MNRKKKSLARPFVISVSAAAMSAVALACGGGVAPVDGSGGSGSDQKTTVNTSNPPRVTSCANASPGSACENEGESCINNTSPCSPQISCVSHEWAFSEVSCNPPPVCPDAAPANGSSCNVVGSACDYADTCESRPPGAPTTKTYVCNGSGTWKLQGETYVASCPTVTPNNGDPCTSCDAYVGTCVYGPVGGGGGGCEPAINLTCNATTGKWQMTISTCPPPPPVDAGG